MRVLLPVFDTPATLMGGVEWYVVNQARALGDAGVAARIVAQRPPQGTPLPPEMEGLDVTWVDLPPDLGQPRYRYRLLADPLFERAVRREAAWADVVHGQNIDGTGAVGVAPVVTTVHTTPVDEWGSARLGGLRELAYQRWVHALRVRKWRRALVWTPGAHVVESLRVLGREDAEVLPNPVPAPEPVPDAEARATLGVPADAGPVIAYLGRVSREKRVDRLVDAVAALDDGFLVVAGTGPELEAVRARATARGIPERSRFLGRVDAHGKRCVFSAADVFVLPSEHEGQPLALVEALAYGVPVVATRAEWVIPELRPFGRWGTDLVELVPEALELAPLGNVPVPTWDDAVERMIRVYERVTARA